MKTRFTLPSIFLRSHISFPRLEPKRQNSHPRKQWQTERRADILVVCHRWIKKKKKKKSAETMGILLVSRNRLKVAGSSGLRRKATMTGSVVHAPATIPSLDWPFLHSTIYSPSPIIPLVLSCFSSRLFISLSSLPFYRFSSISFAISFALRVAVNGNLLQRSFVSPRKIGFEIFFEEYFISHDDPLGRV